MTYIAMKITLEQLFLSEAQQQINAVIKQLSKGLCLIRPRPESFNDACRTINFLISTLCQKKPFFTGATTLCGSVNQLRGRTRTTVKFVGSNVNYLQAVRWLLV